MKWNRTINDNSICGYFCCCCCCCRFCHSFYTGSGASSRTSVWISMADRYLRGCFPITFNGPTKTEFCRVRLYSGGATMYCLFVSCRFDSSTENWIINVIRKSSLSILFLDCYLFVWQQNYNRQKYHATRTASFLALHEHSVADFPTDLPRTVYKLVPGDPENELNRAVVGFGNDAPIDTRENDGLCTSISTSGQDARCCCWNFGWYGSSIRILPHRLKNNVIAATHKSSTANTINTSSVRTIIFGPSPATN